MAVLVWVLSTWPAFEVWKCRGIVGVGMLGWIGNGGKELSSLLESQSSINSEMEETEELISRQLG
jgi:hypothetical protein